MRMVYIYIYIYIYTLRGDDDDDDTTQLKLEGHVGTLQCHLAMLTSSGGRGRPFQVYIRVIVIPKPPQHLRNYRCFSNVVPSS